MPVYRIPTNGSRAIRMANRSTTSGNLVETFNLDLTTDRGKMLPTATRKLFDENDVAITSVPVAFINDADAVRVMAVAGKVAFVNTATGVLTTPGDWTLMAGTNAPTAGTDGTFFNNEYVVVDGSNIKRSSNTPSASSAWTSTAGTSGQEFCEVLADRLYVAGSFGVHSFNSSWTLASSGTYTWALPTSETHLTWIKSLNNRIYIGTSNENTGVSSVWEWDGQTENIAQRYLINTPYTCSAEIYNGNLYTFDAFGRLLAFNGSTFVEVASISDDRNHFLGETGSTPLYRFVHKNGMKEIDGKLYIAINPVLKNISTLDGSGSDQMAVAKPAGVYEYDSEIGLYHKYSPTDCHYSLTTDFGASRPTTTSEMGALHSTATHRAEVSGSTLYKRILFGVTVNEGKGDVADDVYTVQGTLVEKDAKSLSSYFITSELLSETAESNWTRVFLKLNYDYTTNETRQIIVKHRRWQARPTFCGLTITAEVGGFYTPGGSNGNTFLPDRQRITATTDIDITDYLAGDEVFIVTGKNAGMPCSIVSTSNLGGGSYEVVFLTDYSRSEFIDFNVGEEIGVKFTNWRYTGFITSDDKALTQIDFNPNVQSSAFQLKVYYYRSGIDKRSEIQQVIIKEEPTITI